MAISQRNYLPVANDCRQQPRLEFHLPVTIMGVNVRARILDFSRSGFYIQIDGAAFFSEGQSLKLALRFPGEENVSVIKVRVQRTEENGIGCSFLDPDPGTQELIDRNFDIFSGTLPIL